MEQHWCLRFVPVRCLYSAGKRGHSVGLYMFSTAKNRVELFSCALGERCLKGCPTARHQRGFGFDALEKVLSSLTENTVLVALSRGLVAKPCLLRKAAGPGGPQGLTLGAIFHHQSPQASDSREEREGRAELGSCRLPSSPHYRPCHSPSLSSQRMELHLVTVMRLLAGNKGTGVITSPWHKHMKSRVIICASQCRR